MLDAVLIMHSTPVQFSDMLALMPNDNMEGDKLVDSSCRCSLGVQGLERHSQMQIQMKTLLAFKPKIYIAVPIVNKHSYLNTKDQMEGDKMVDSFQMQNRVSWISKAQIFLLVVPLDSHPDTNTSFARRLDKYNYKYKYK